MYHSGLKSHRGRKKENQDTAVVLSCDLLGFKSVARTDEFFQKPFLLGLVADGVSSCREPKKASGMAAEGFYRNLLSATSRRRIQFIDDVEWCLAQALGETNAQLYFEDEQSRTPGLLSTLVGVLCFEQRIFYFSIGDSRFYLYSQQTLECLTNDDVDRGERGRALNQALGSDLKIQAQYGCRMPAQEDVYCLVTDGISDAVDDTELEFWLKQAGTHCLNELAANIVNAAWENGGRDNLTCIIISGSREGQVQGFSSSYKKRIPENLVIGDEIDGFKIKDIIHQSSRSMVFRVRSLELAVDLALKVPSGYFSDDQDYITRFLREEHIGLSLQHEGLLSFKPKPMGSPWIYHLTELIEGQSLRTFLDHHEFVSHQLCFELSQGIMLSLRALHRNHYLHQDIKPENIMLLEQGVKLIDFGSIGSLVFKGDSSQPPGSLDYAAPEYFSTANAQSTKGIASDLFSFAVVVYEMLTGRLPFTSQYIASESHYLRFTAPHVYNPELPIGLDDVFARAFCVNVNNRYQSISEFVADLDPVLFESQCVRQGPLIERNPVLFWKGLSGFLFLIILLLFMALGDQGGGV